MARSAAHRGLSGASRANRISAGSTPAGPGKRAGTGTWVALLALLLGMAAPARATDLLFVSNEGDDTVSVLDAETRQPIRTIAVGPRPRGLGLSPNGDRLYVALGRADQIAVVDTLSLRVVERIPAGSDPEAFAVHPGGHIYVSNEDEGTASVLDPRSGERLAVLQVGIEPEGVAVSHDGSRVLVAAESTSTLHIFSVPEHDAVATLLVGARPREAVFSPDDRFAYVSSEIAREVAKVDMRENRVAEKIQLSNPATKPKGLVLSEDGNTLFVATGSADQVAVLDADTLELQTTIAVGRRPWGVARSSDGRFLYTANGLDNNVSVIDLESREQVATLPVGRRPWGVVVLSSLNASQAAPSPAR